jgi:hypothetical protein
LQTKQKKQKKTTSLILIKDRLTIESNFDFKSWNQNSIQIFSVKLKCQN